MAEPLPIPDGQMSIRCPRCGYDQRGVMAAWTESCPQSGTCSECGLAFDWRDIVDPREQLPRWCIESARTWGQTLWYLPQTIFVMMWPLRFWSRLDMIHRIRPWAFVRSLVIVAMVSALLAAVGVGFRAAEGAATSKAPPAMQVLTGVYAALMPLSDSPSAWYALPNYQRSVIPGVFRSPCPVDWWRPYIGRWYWPRPTLIQSALATSDWSLVWGGIWLWDFNGVLLILVTLLIPICLGALPRTGVVARVQPHHVLRIAAYSMAWSAMLVLLRIVLMLGQSPILFSMRHWIWPVLSLVIGPLWLWIWWYSAALWYLKMPDAGSIAATAVGLACLLVALIVFGPAALAV